MSDIVVKPGIRVFVYGSLKQGKGNNRLLSNSELLGRTKLRGKYSMLDMRFYPGLIMDPTLKEDRDIVGEVYRISKEELDTLDMLEGHPEFYARHKVQTPWKGAWCYFLPSAYMEQAPLVPPVEGDVQVWRPSDEEVEWLRKTA